MESSSKVTMSERKDNRSDGYKMHQTSEAGRFRAAAAMKPAVLWRIHVLGWYKNPRTR